MATIRNPVEWSVDLIGATSGHLASMGRAVRGHGEAPAAPAIRQIGVGELRTALRRGVDDFVACRSDVVLVGVVYALAGLLLCWVLFDYRLLPLVFPAVSGFALVGPAAAVGLIEMSRRRERDGRAGWGGALGVLRSPSFGAIFLLGLGLVALFVLWMVVAHGIWAVTLGPEPPDSFGAFARDVIFTGPGWIMAVVGCAVGFLFALVALAVSLVSFPLLLDRDVGLGMAVVTSVRVAAANPGATLAWGAIVAAGLALGTLPLFLGLIVVVPVLGHATWHLYRAAVAVPADDAGA